ncbi:MAG: hypothetical protein FJ257_10235 [Phycisphaerae bacterium]|nr:hypothetical protein [Phycisphaerae bacterium]
MNLGDGPAWLPLVGVIEVVVREVRPVSIHGDQYLDLVVSPDGREVALVRAPLAACATPPRGGDRVRLHLLMRQVDRVERLA